MLASIAYIMPKEYSMIFSTADIYWFSGTGNTLLLANRVAETLSESGVDVRMRAIASSLPADVDTNRALGIAVPVAMQGTFSFIWSFTKQLPFATGTPVFFIDTLLGYSGGILYPLKRILSSRGYKPVGAKEFIMPSNIFLKIGMTEKKQEKINKSLKNAAQFARRLIEGKTTWFDIPGYSNMLSSISRSKGFWNFCRRLTPPRVDAALCNNCGLCIRLCPISNIADEKPPRHKNGCQFCMRCFSFCPQNAIYFEHYKSAQYRAVKAAAFQKD